MRQVLLSFLIPLTVLSVGASGCTSQGTSQPDAITLAPFSRAAAEPDSLIEKRLGQTISKRGGGTASDWFVLAGASSPEGAITGFRWTIPTGGTIGLREAGPPAWHWKWYPSWRAGRQGAPRVSWHPFVVMRQGKGGPRCGCSTAACRVSLPAHRDRLLVR